jgi:osmotically-inducible protein OsmY
LDAATITVSAQDGRVVLDGNVKSLLERQLAEQTAWSAPGVTAVIDRIHIQ